MRARRSAWKVYHSTGEMKSLTNWASNRQEGLAQEWYSGGAKKSEKSFAGGRPEGLWTGWYESGAKKSEETYVAGVKSGSMKAWYENGNPKSETTLDTGVKQGLSSDYFESGTKKKAVEFDKGKVRGSFKEWHANGKPWSDGAYGGEGDASEPVGVWTSWFENGTVAAKVDYASGKATVHAADGSVWLDLTQRDGAWYDSVRDTTVAGAFSDGKANGVWTITDGNGKKLSQTKIKKGVVTGEASYWHGTGVLATQGKHAAGVRTGTWPQWDATGKLLAVTCYDKGSKAWISFEAVDAKVSCP